MNYEELPLRGMHLPEQISWWPLAMGWYIALALALFTAIAIWRIRIWQQNRLSTHLRRELDAIGATFQVDGDSIKLATSLSTFIRQSVLSIYPRQEVAAVTSDKWLRLLDELNRSSLFTQGLGGQIFTCAYSHTELEQPQQTLKEIEKWLIYALAHRKKGGLHV